jgi:hypothetical protein
VATSATRPARRMATPMVAQIECDARARAAALPGRIRPERQRRLRTPTPTGPGPPAQIRARRAAPRTTARAAPITMRLPRRRTCPAAVANSVGPTAAATPAAPAGPRRMGRATPTRPVLAAASTRRAPTHAAGRWAARPLTASDRRDRRATAGAARRRHPRIQRYRGIQRHPGIQQPGNRRPARTRHPGRPRDSSRTATVRWDAPMWTDPASPQPSRRRAPAVPPPRPARLRPARSSGTSARPRDRQPVDRAHGPRARPTGIRRRPYPTCVLLRAASRRSPNQAAAHEGRDSAEGTLPDRSTRRKPPIRATVDNGIGYPSGVGRSTRAASAARWTAAEPYANESLFARFR